MIGANAIGGLQAEARLGSVEVVLDAYRRAAVKRAVVYDVADEAAKNLRDCVLDADGKVWRWGRGVGEATRRGGGGHDGGAEAG